MGSSREDSEEQFTLNTDYSPPATCDLGTQQLIARLAAEEERNNLRADDVNDGNKQAQKTKKIMLVDSEEESDVEITPPTRSSKPHRQTTFGTATRKPMLQSTLDGGSGSSARAHSQKKAPLKVVIRGGRRKASTQALSSEARKKKGSSSRSQKNKKKVEEEIPNLDDDLEEVELDDPEIDLEEMENRQRNEYAWYYHSHGTSGLMRHQGRYERPSDRKIWKLTVYAGVGGASAGYETRHIRCWCDNLPGVDKTHSTIYHLSEMEQQ
ncbi:hypothetical protein HID58_064573 [Brassica napus]|uniref:Uncharacterized protein n=1 Tax=Brassica napus TaxID=3708 RepID=A0ABQ7ZAK7_BRANA|nr:hypothetical protein HID58_064573 [Brassica napus]